MCCWDLGVRGSPAQGLIEHQGPDMGGDRCAKRIQIIASLQHGNHAPFGMARGQGAEFFRNPGEIRLRQPKLRQRVRDMRIKPSRDDQQFRRESIQGWQQKPFPYGAKRGAIGARWCVPLP